MFLWALQHLAASRVCFKSVWHYSYVQFCIRVFELRFNFYNYLLRRIQEQPNRNGFY